MLSFPFVPLYGRELQGYILSVYKRHDQCVNDQGNLCFDSQSVMKHLISDVGQVYRGARR